MKQLRYASWSVALVTALILSCGFVMPAQAATSPIARTHLKVGEKAPDFTLLSDHWKPVSLKSELGKHNVLLAFYVLAFTPG